jgi:PAS domain S-box-containing protein
MMPRDVRPCAEGDEAKSRLDWFIPARLRSSADAQRRMRQFVAAHLLGPPFGLVVALRVVMLDWSPSVAAGALAAVALMMAYPLALRWTGRFRLVTLAATQHFVALVLAGAYFSGGLASPLLGWLVLVPLGAVVYAGSARGLRSALLLMAAGGLAAFAVADLTGLAAPERVPLADLASLGLVSLACAGGLVAVLALHFTRLAAAQEQRFAREVYTRRLAETELRAAVDAAERLSASFRLMFRSNPVPMLLYDRGTLGIIEVNDAAIAQWGYGRDRFLALGMGDIRPAEEVPRLKALVAGPRAPFDQTTDWTFVKADGTRFLGDCLFHEVAFEGRAAGLVAVLDVTEQRRAAAAVSDSEARYRLLAEHATDMITRAALDGTRLYVSPAVREVLGYAPEELVGTSLFELPFVLDREVIADAVASFRGGEERATVVTRVQHKAGAIVWLESSLRLVRDPASGKPCEVVAVSRDVSARVALQEALARAKELAEAASRAKSEFLANMSHELRTPLNAIMGFGDLIEHELMGPVGNARYVEYAHDIVESGRHLLALISDILDLAKVDAGRLAVSEDLVELRHVADECVTMLSERARAGGIRVDVAIARELGAVRGDERRLKQILINLLTNSIKFTPAGGRVAVAAARDERGGLALAVSDTGIGIAPQDIPRVLEPFVQVDGPLNRRTEGTGLGLPLTKRLVEIHGGTLEIASEPGRGTTVTVRLPPERVVAAAAA